MNNKKNKITLYFGKKNEEEGEEEEGEEEEKNRKIKRVNNHLYFYSKVDRDSIFDLIMLIKETEEENRITAIKLNIDTVPIYLHINSNGGHVYEALNAIDAINACKVPVYTIVEGATASAGTLMSVAGKKRYIRPNAYMLIHQLSSSYWGGKMSEIEDEFKNLQELMEKIREIYKKHTKIPKKELTELLKHDLYLNAEKSINYGLADELWT
jgi:ATP-dependent Clp endopeptidase proteolytic subunit ClpP